MTNVKIYIYLFLFWVEKIYFIIFLCKNTHRPNIFDTQPLETWRILEISHGRAPEWANSTIFCLVESGRGLPPTKTPPNWFTPLCPASKYETRNNKFWSTFFIIGVIVIGSFNLIGNHVDDLKRNKNRSLCSGQEAGR